MRADRLVATLLLLQVRGRVTAAELEVSLKTARRDLEALSLAGIPIYSQPGLGGGWRLLGGARTDLSGLTAAEARTLFLIAGPSAAVSPEAKAALRKLMRALPASFRATAEAAAAATVLDPSGWGADPTPDPPPELQRAVIERMQVRLAYRDASDTDSERVVHPLGLVAKGEAWYLIADTDAGRRTFRVDRIRAVEATGLPAVRPEGFDLAEAWRAIAASVEERRTRVRAVVKADAAIVAGLRAQLGADVSVGKREADGQIGLRISGSSAHIIAEQLAGWGRGLEVVGPEEVRGHLARIGAELIEAYGEPATRGLPGAR